MGHRRRNLPWISIQALQICKTSNLISCLWRLIQTSDGSTHHSVRLLKAQVTPSTIPTQVRLQFMRTVGYGTFYTEMEPRLGAMSGLTKSASAEFVSTTNRSKQLLVLVLASRHRAAQMAFLVSVSALLMVYSRIIKRRGSRIWNLCSSNHFLLLT